MVQGSGHFFLPGSVERGVGELVEVGGEVAVAQRYLYEVTRFSVLRGGWGRWSGSMYVCA